MKLILLGALLGAGSIVAAGLAWERHMRAVRPC